MENLINWGELSRLLCGTRSVLLRRSWRKSVKHKKALEALMVLLKNWKDEYVV